jgi:hypothetical protein
MYTRFGLLLKYPLLFEKQSNASFINVRPVGAEMFHADGKTDRHDEANCRLSQFYWCWSHVTLCNEAHRPPTYGKYRQVSFYASDTLLKTVAQIEHRIPV